jgi:hypothetical protein
MRKNLLTTILLLAICIPFALAQDSLIFKNNNYVVGEVKSFDRGVLTIETAYSKSDFTVEWSGIQKIFTKTIFMATLTNGDRITGVLSSPGPDRVSILDNSGVAHDHALNEIVSMKSVSTKFWDRFHAGISFGYSLTKAQNLKQLTLRSNLSYATEAWIAEASYNNLHSSQDEVEDVRRSDGGLNFNYFLPKDWYIPISATFLSNTEQKLDLRLLGKLGIGKYVIHTNSAYWGFTGGAAANFEDYDDDADPRESWEAFIGTEANLFDIGDLSLMSRAVVYPSLTESDRIRADFVFDTKYDLPRDFYIQLGVTVNYDNKPVEGAQDTDYVFQTTFGWKWN